VKLFLKLIVVFFLLSSCVNVKYIYFIDKNNSLDVSNGKWILNKPYLNQEINHIEDIALKGFRSIIRDSLFEIDNLRSSYLIGVKPPYEPLINELKDLKTGTDCDYLINYKVEIISDELNSFILLPPIGTVRRTNEVLVEIAIYDLKTAELLSRSSMRGESKLDINAEDSEGNFADSAHVISRKTLIRLLNKYNKNYK
jgi:hypothetical protein